MSEVILPGVLYVVSTPIGNLEDISHRAIKILSGVNIVVAEDTRTTGNLLQHYGVRTQLLSYHSHNEQKRIPELLRLLESGKSLALVTDAGTPGISDPAFGILSEAARVGVKVIAIPGASALLPALVVSGLPMNRFAFEGFLPLKKGRRSKLERLKEEERTIVFYESPHRLLKTVHELKEVLGDRNVAVVREITKKFEEVVRGSIDEVIASLEKKEPRGEYVIVVGPPDYRAPKENV